MEIKEFKYKLIDSKMYIMIENNEALIIDPCISEEGEEYLIKHNVNALTVIPTHEHYDHISGINHIKEVFANCSVVCSWKCHDNMQSSVKNGSKFFSALFFDKDKELLEEASKVEPITCKGDRMFACETIFKWHGHTIFLKETPGHSPGSICIVIDEKYLFTGDSLIKNEPVITRLPGGSLKEYNKITKPFLKRISKDIHMYVYPGHGESGCISEFTL